MRTLLPIAILMAALPAAATDDILAHAVGLRFDLDGHRVTITDTLTVPDGLDRLRLGADFADGLSGATPVEDDADARLVSIPVTRDLPDGRMLLTCTAELFESTAAAEFSRENVGREIRATVSEEGIYLSGAAYWLAGADGVMATHRLAIDTPAGWKPVTQGRRLVDEPRGDRHLTVWEAKMPSDGLTLIAGPYLEFTREFDDVTARVFLLSDEPRLVETYLDHTGEYLELYEAMIGPYPYAKFATVENWFPTGYGMPSWTLLGGVVLRLPFIPDTSFGHEIAHNWWGNSVFVDADSGNWCEGLTVYCADYHYKTLDSPEAAREYRRNLLKDYAAYVGEDRDFPLREFRERHSGATRAIGYGKSMMVFHMVERLIGREAFVGALRDVYRDFRFRRASWDDFMAAFEKRGDVDLDGFKERWLDRPGAPTLDLGEVERDGGRIRFELSMDGDVDRARVPVVVGTPDGDVEHVVDLVAGRNELRIEAPEATRLAVDPDYHVFRRLHPAEIEPTLSRVLAEDRPDFVLPTGAAAAVGGRRFAEAYIEDGEPNYVALEDDTPRSRILINPSAATLKDMLPEGAQVVAGQLFIEGKRWRLSVNDAVLSVYRPGHGGLTDLVVLTRNPSKLEALAGRIGHYGKYSWLVFQPRGRPERGNWPTDDSPLAIQFR